MFFKLVEPTKSCKSFASLPFIQVVTESLPCNLKKHDVTVVNKPFTTQQQFPALKFQASLESQTNVVYKIPCTIVHDVILGKPAELLIPEKKEHLRNTKTAAMPGPTTTPLILKMRHLLTKAPLEPGKH